MRRRRSRRPRLRLIPTLFAFGFVGAAMAVPWAVQRAGVTVPLKIRDLKIVGGKVLSSTDLKALTGLKEGDPLFKKSVDALIEKLKSHPRVAQVAMVRNAAGNVQIRIEERKPAALVSFGELYFTDAEGNLFAKADPADPKLADYVVITGAWTGSLRGADRPPSADLREGLALLAAMAGAGIGESDISEIHLDPSRGWVVYRTASGLRAVIGRTEFAVKAKRLKRVLRDYERRESAVREIDLDFDDRAVVKLKRTT